MVKVKVVYLPEDPLTGTPYAKEMEFHSSADYWVWNDKVIQIKEWAASNMKKIELYNENPNPQLDTQIDNAIRSWLDNSKSFVSSYGQSFVPRDIRYAINAAEEELGVPMDQKIGWKPEVGLVDHNNFRSNF